MNLKVMSNRAKLLSDYARSFISTDKTVEKKGFWTKLKSAFIRSLNKPVVVPVNVDKAKKENDYIAEGFIPFCSIGPVKILIRPSENKREIIAFENDSFVDFSFRDSRYFEALVLSFLYLSAIDDDFSISEEESHIIEALVKCLHSSSSTISEAKQFAFIGILNKFVSDKDISDYEKLSVSKIAKALELDRDDISMVELKFASVIELISKIPNIGNSTTIDNAAISDLTKDLQEFGLSMINYKQLLDASGISSENIINGIQKLKGLLVSQYHRLLNLKKDLSQSDIEEFSQYALQIGIQQEWIKYYTELLEESIQNNFIEQTCQTGNLMPIKNPPVIMKKG